MSNFILLPNVEAFANNDITTLSANIGASDTVISVASVNNLAQLGGQFRLLIDSELLVVTGIDIGTNQFQVQRGQEGTTAASHSSGAQVVCILTAGALTKLKYDSGKVYIYREGWPFDAQGANVYATFDAAHQAAESNLPATIVIDNTLVEQGYVGNSVNYNAAVSSVVGSTATLTGLVALYPRLVGTLIGLSGEIQPGNIGVFTITAVLSSTSLQIDNPSAVAGDQHIIWNLVDGTAGSVTAGPSNLALITGLYSAPGPIPQGGINPSMVGQPITFINAGSPANDGTFTIYAYVSSSSILIQNASAVSIDSATWVIDSGSTASITAYSSGFVTMTGLSGITAEMVGYAIFVSGASNGGNNGQFTIASVLSSSSVTFENFSGVAPDANNGAISWQISPTNATIYQTNVPTVTVSGLVNVGAQTGNALTIANSNYNSTTAPILAWVSDTTVLINPLNNISFTTPDPNNGSLWWHIGDDYDLSEITLTAFPGYSATLFLNDGATFNEGIAEVTGPLAVQGNYNSQPYAGTLGVSLFGYYNPSINVIKGAAILNEATQDIFDLSFTSNSYYVILDEQGSADHFAWMGNTAITLQVTIYTGGTISGRFVSGTSGSLNVLVYDTNVTPPTSYGGFYGTPGDGVQVQYLAQAATLVPFTESSPPSPNNGPDATGPYNVQTGTMYFNTDSNQPFWYTGSTWVSYVGTNSLAVTFGHLTPTTRGYNLTGNQYNASAFAGDGTNYGVVLLGSDSASFSDINANYAAFLSGDGAKVTSGWSVVAGGYHNNIGGSLSNYGYNVIGGGYENQINETYGYSFIGGGQSNLISTEGGWNFIGGGFENYFDNGADSYCNVIVGGDENFITSPGNTNTICGGYRNSINGSDSEGPYYCFVGGGESNTIGSGTYTNCSYSNINGGYDNYIYDQYATIGGGYGNYIASGGSYAIIGGGVENEIESGEYATIGGGTANLINGGTYGTIAGGQQNQVTGARGTIGGGSVNIVSDQYATVAGGSSNEIESGEYATIAGGSGNFIEGGTAATIGGGAGNQAGDQYTTVAGGSSNNVQEGASYGAIGGGANNVVTGEGAVISGGFNNTAAGARAVVAGGDYNQAQGADSSVGGVRGLDYSVNGSRVLSSGSFSSINGSSQVLEVQFRGSSASIGTINLGCGDDGSGNPTQTTLTLPSNGLFNIVVDGAAMSNATNISYKAWTTRIVVQTLSSSTPTVLDQTDILAPYGTGPDAAGWSISATGVSANNLQINFTTGAADSTYITLNLRIVQLVPPV